MSNLKLLLIVTALSLSGSFHFGYLLVIWNPAQHTFKMFLNESFNEHMDILLGEEEFNYVWPLFLHLLIIGAFVGSTLLKILTEKFGRKNCFYMVTVLQFLGCILSGTAYFSHSWELLVLGRCISGIGIGISLGLQPMYFSEISPKSVLGLVNGVTGITLQFAFVFGSIVALPSLMGSRYLWHWLFWIELSTLFCPLAVLPFLPESPKYLLASKNDYDSARQSLIYFSHENIDEDLKEIAEEIKTDKTTVDLQTLWKTPFLRRGLLLGFITIVACQCSGIGAITLYSTEMFIKAGFSEEIAPYATLGVTFNAFFATIIASFMVDRVGRKPLIISTLITLTCLNAIYAVFTYVGRQSPQIQSNFTSEPSTQWASYVCVADSFLFTFVFGLGPAIVMWFITAELMPQNARSTAMSYVQACQWIVAAFVNGAFYPLVSIIGELSYLVFIIPLTFGSIYLYYKLPETKNKTTLEIIKILGYKEEERSSSSTELDKLVNSKSVPR